MQELRRLGPIGGRMHRGRRREIEQRVAGCDAEIAGHDALLVGLDRELGGLAPAVARRREWERQRAVELRWLHDLDRRIGLIERLDRMAARGLDQRVARAVGVEL